MKNLRGKVLDSVLIVHCKHRIRLELVSEEGTWLADQRFWEEGKLEERKKGHNAPATFLRSWRELRKRHPSLSAARG